MIEKLNSNINIGLGINMDINNLFNPDFLLNNINNIINSEKNKQKESDKICNNYFNLPISFLENKRKTETNIIDDLELNDNDNNKKSLYEYIFNSENYPFSKKNIPLWNAYYTSDINFLKESQQLIINDLPKVKNNYKDIYELWNNIKGEKNFESKFLYVELDTLNFLNKSPLFLQCMSMYNMSSPIFSLILPIFMLIVPLFILKFQNIEISLEQYIDVLKYMSQKHQLGQLFMLGSVSWEKRVYILFSIGFYFLQIYQNVMSCIRFYSNMTIIKTQMTSIISYLTETIDTMDEFVYTCKDFNSYNPFIKHMINHKQVLINMLGELNEINDYTFSFKRFNSIGCIMKNFYKLYKNIEYHQSLEYSFGFNGYIHNLNNLKIMVNEKYMSKFTFMVDKNKNKNKNKNKIKFKNAYFPSLINNKPIKNTYNLNKCMLITGPNAAGKTTLIKTTLFNILCCQQMGFGFFDKCLFDPFDYIHSYINIPDITGRDSLFQSEARRCKNILDIIMENGKEKSHFCVFDELFSGTNPYEAIASSVSFLRYLKNNTNSINMITTHFLNICNKMEKEENVCSMYMEILNSNTNINDFSYTYKIKKGISHIKGGVKVLKDLGYPQLIIDDTIKLINQ